MTPAPTAPGNAPASSPDPAPSARPSRWRGLGAWASATAAVLGLLYTRLLLGEVVVSRDTSRMVYPMKAYFVERIRAGELPLWYPYEALGTPFLGSAVTAVFHPLSWLAIPFGPIAGHALATLATLLVLSGGVWRLVRSLEGSVTAAALATLFALGGGSVISGLDNQTFAWGVAAYPWFLYGVRLLAGPAPRRGGVWVAGAVAWAILAGDVQAVVIMALSGGVAVWAWAPRPRPRAILRLGGAGVLGAAVSAVQLLPAIPVFLSSARPGGLPAEKSAVWSTHPLRIPELFLGDLLQFAPLAGPTRHELLHLDGRQPWVLSAYLGALVALGVLLALGGRHRARRSAWLLGGLAVAALVLALGRHGGLWWVFRRIVPLWDAFRYPEKLLAYAQVLLATLAGLGLGSAAGGSRAGPRLAALLAAALAGLATALALWPAPADPNLAGWWTAATMGAWRAAAYTAGAALLFLLHRRRLLRAPGLVGLLLALLVLADLTSAHGRLVGLMSAPPRALNVPSPVARRILSEVTPGPGAPRVTSLSDGPLGLAPEDLETASFLGVALWDRASLQPDHNALFHLPSTQFYLPGLDARVHRVLTGPDWETQLELSTLFGSRYFTLPLHLYRQLPEVARVESWPDVHVGLAVSQRALPHLFLARPLPAPDAEAAFAQLTEDPVQAGDVALVEGWGGPMGPKPDARIDVLRYEPERIEAVVDTEADAFLVQNDAWAPGWGCTVDGETTRLYRVNYAVRGLAVPAGRHRVDCVLPPPPSLLAGAAVSLLGLLTLLWLWRRGDAFRHLGGGEPPHRVTAGVTPVTSPP